VRAPHHRRENEQVLTSEERQGVLDWIFAVARADERITGGAVTGSRSVGREDRWSDIDTVFGFAEDAEPPSILRDWTDALTRDFDVVHQFDLRRDPTTYRVFLLSNGLEVDISLTPKSSFRPHGPTFRLVFGEAAEQPSHDVDRNELVGWGWIFLLYARAAIERGRPWQAEYGIREARNTGLALACLRYDLPASDARGNDDLPDDVTRSWRASLVRSLAPDELRRALRAAGNAYLGEVHAIAPELADRLEPMLL
jgi:hypothetical protein